MFLDIIQCLVLSKNRPVYFSKHNVSETGFCLRLQVKPTQLGPIDRDSPCLRIGPNFTEDGDRIISETSCFEKETRQFLDKDKTMGNVQKHNICTNVSFFTNF
jgi:hypothetical protein